MRYLISAALLTLAIGVAPALAQTSSAPPSADEKKAISKSCSDQANAKGLHGKARKRFRSECKHAGSKAQ
jgi:psiF repeat-containing protein